jgi:SAM-dependent methyltransferase
VSNSYDRAFYDSHLQLVRSSAEEIVPMVLDLVKPKSVADVGCGIGTWLSVCKANGVSDLLGLDGEWVDRTQLEIGGHEFVVADLLKPLALRRRFDLAMSLEVGEHLTPSAAALLVDSLVSLSPVVLFSAAIPFQNGVDHVNEQWPQYWADRFAQRGYLVADPIRAAVWENDRVAWWYAQNLLLFVHASHPLAHDPHLHCGTSARALVHPKNYGRVVRELEWHAAAPSLSEALAALPGAVERWIGRAR